MPLYCVRCKAKTPDAGKIVVSKTKNGRNIAKVKCEKCGGTKTQFVKAPPEK